MAPAGVLWLPDWRRWTKKAVAKMLARPVCRIRWMVGYRRGLKLTCDDVRGANPRPRVIDGATYRETGRVSGVSKRGLGTSLWWLSPFSLSLVFYPRRTTRRQTVSSRLSLSRVF